ncbi:MAG: LysR family transcriptional regulator [Thomasclavelia sp.]|nr:LysR family transcriptional regulator [Thomasclavelia sp.]
MEFRVLEYFLAVAREQNISAAAKSLHLSQPTLSRQLHDLEDELGKSLFIRGSRKITLTEEGIILRKRAEEIVNLMQMTENEITMSDEHISGDIYIGTGESEGVRLIIEAGLLLQKEYPDIHIHTISGDSLDILEKLDNGLYDFAVVWEPTDISSYESISLPYKDVISLLMPRNCELAKKEKITLNDLASLPIIVSRHQLKDNFLDYFFNENKKMYNIVATYNLIFNASLMVQEGMGYAIGFNHIINTSKENNLICKPLYPKVELGMNLIKKKYQTLSKPAKLYLKKIEELIALKQQ